MRTNYTAEDIDASVKQLEAVVVKLKACASAMRKAKKKTILAHTSWTANRGLPMIRKWSAILEIDCLDQIDSAIRGLPDTNLRRTKVCRGKKPKYGA